MDTASGEKYEWPPHDDMWIASHGEGRPAVAVGVVPHANEPLGCVLRTTMKSPMGPGRLAMIGPVDPPPPDARFPLPCDFVTYLERGFLHPLAEQAEFAHRADPRTQPQRRAARLRELVSGADVLMLVHNDAFATFPYLYASRPWPEAEHALRADPYFPDAELEPALWTRRLTGRAYAYFPARRIGVRGTESAGLFIPEHLGIEVLTLELPMFSWPAEAGPLRQALRRAMGFWIAKGAGYTAPLATTARALLGDLKIEMIPAPVTARLLRSVLTAIRAESGNALAGAEVGRRN